jgi:hypothetical protein
MHKQKGVNEAEDVGGEEKSPEGREDKLWDRVKWDRHKELTPTWVTRCISAMVAELGNNIGERTRHALKPRIEELHAIGLKSEQAGKILAYEYKQHSTKQKETQRAAWERDQARRERDEAIAQLRSVLEKTGAAPPGLVSSGPGYVHVKARQGGPGAFSSAPLPTPLDDEDSVGNQ